MSIDVYLDSSYNQYIAATLKFNNLKVNKIDYKNYLLNAVANLKDCNDGAYVIVDINTLYMKVKKVGENVDVSYMDKETFNLITNYNNQKENLTV
jgi:hypothetical protein